MQPLRAIALTLLALAATGAYAQAPAPLVVENNDDGATTALPIIRNNQIEGFLLIESDASAGARSLWSVFLRVCLVGDSPGRRSHGGLLVGSVRD